MMVLLGLLALVGLSVASTTAQAHQGHAHHGAQAHHADKHHHSVHLDARTIPTAQVMSRAPADEPADGLADTCNGACCAASHSCCGSAMASLAVALGPTDLRSLRIAIRAGPIGPGIDPEALPKPPKSFA
jgi:hypothetical protein